VHEKSMVLILREDTKHLIQDGIEGERDYVVMTIDPQGVITISNVFRTILDDRTTTL